MSLRVNSWVTASLPDVRKVFDFPLVLPFDQFGVMPQIHFFGRSHQRIVRTLRKAKGLPHIRRQSRNSLARVNLFLNLSHCSADVSRYRRFTIIHHRRNKISDQRRMQIRIRRMSFTSFTLLAHHTH